LKKTTKLIAICAMMTLAGSLFAQQGMAAPLQNVVQLTASGSVEVGQDLLSITLNTTREGADANAVQTQLKTALDAALGEAKKSAQPGQMEVRTGNFSLYPRYGRDGKSIGWQGSTELVLEGRDFARISSTAGKIQTLTLANVSFALSREQRAKVEGEAQSMAIDRFKVRATEIARSFGLTGYTLREVNVSADDQGFSPRPRMLAMQAKAMAADAPVSVEAGKTSVVVTVSGSVQLK
jgi:predicted secreted protein